MLDPTSDDTQSNGDPAVATLAVETPLGPFTITANEAAVVRVARSRHDGRQATPTEDSAAMPLCRETARELDAYFAGTLRSFTVPTCPAGSPFQQAAWQQLLAIDFGQTRTYGDVARRLGDLGASRAVGVACGANPIPLIIPCHRVVAAAGGLGGFGLGLPAKEWLLAHEGARALQLGLFG